ncbi:MAG: FGGY-family carbohydrate kinase, partial [Acidimicrobiia bacterium]
GAGAGPAIAAISVAAQQHGMVALDAQRTVIRPAKLWNDTESAPDSSWLIGQLPGGAADWAAACGTVPVASLTITKLSWLHRSEPAAWERLAHVLLPHDWLTSQLTGRLTTDRGDASGTGYWSPAEGGYRWDLLRLVDAERDWSTVVPEVLGPLDAAGDWNGTIVGPGTGDNMAAALGLGLRRGDVVISLGTSGTVFTVSDTAVADPSGSIAGFADASGRFLPLACTLNATKVTDSIARLLGVDHEELDRLALAGPPGADGLVLLPYFDGERTPNRPSATGVLAGLRSGVSRAELARAAFEGVACGLIDALDALRELVPGPMGRVLLTGGGARSAAYRQIFADLLGQEVTVADADESVATGAAVQAAAVLEQRPHGEIAARWGLGSGHQVEPGAGATVGADVRAAYAAVRDVGTP